MNCSNLRRTAFATLAASFMLHTGIAAAADPGPVGERIAINGSELYPQIDPAIATGPDGNFVAVWQSQPKNSGGYYSVMARAYSANGEALGRAAIKLHEGSYSAGDKAVPAVAIGANGDFVVTWVQPYDGATVGTAIHAQRVSASGALIGSVIGVDFEPAYNSAPSVAIDAQGRFMIAWQAERDGITSIQSQRFNADGTRNGTRRILSDATQFKQEHPSVATNPRGEFVVAWDTFLKSSILAQRFNSDGTLRGAPVFIGGPGQSGKPSQRPAVAVDRNGAFVVAWEGPAGSSSGYDIVARGVTATGSLAGPQFNVSGLQPGDQTGAAISINLAGEFVVGWTRSTGSSGTGISAQRFNANGGLIGPEINVSNGNAGTDRRPAIGLDADGDLVAAWHGVTNLNSSYDIFAQRYQATQRINLSLVQSDSKDPAPTAGALTYTINVSNFDAPEYLTGIAAIDAGLGAATGVTVEDSLPTGVTNVSASGANWLCTLPTGKVVCRYTQVLRAGMAASPLEVRLTTPNSNGVTLQNDASVRGNQLDDNTINDREVERTRLQTGA
ncbi:hypothetical protein [Nevskia sp.]|uniref:hypothetical protein n=1 Tax=Nevskia sp. TaxID=1929292 RepID=UPI0025E9CF88|nr:hypothetical protein [Nevskia sp.]